MVSLILALLKNLPASFKVAIGAGLVVAGLQVSHWWTVRGLKKQITTQVQIVKDQKAEIASCVAQNAKLTAAIAEQNQNITNLHATIRSQSEQVNAYALKAKASDARAAQSAMEAVFAGERAAGAIRANQDRPSGAEALNRELAERFAR